MIVLALVGNNADMYQYEEVTNDEGLALAKELNCIYQRTSFKENSDDIDKLFKNIGKQFLDPNIEINYNNAEELKNKGEKLMRERIKYKQKKNNSC